MFQDDIVITETDGVEIVTTPVEPLDVNASLVRCKKSGKAVLIDPGGEAERLVELARERNHSLQWILHTHGHFDHCGGTDEVMAQYGGALRMALHPDDLMIYKSTERSALFFGIHVPKRETEPDHNLVHGETISFGEVRMRVIHTPGHSPGSCCFYLEDEGVLFSGDTLFAGGIGRTDLPGGNYGDILESIRERLFTLPESTRVIPGHAEFTTIGMEKRYNPFIRQG